MKKNLLTILIPILNEEKIILNFLMQLKEYPDELDILFCDGGSSDKSVELIKASPYKIIHKKVSENSILNTLSLAKAFIKTPYVMIHPIDIQASYALKKLNTIDTDYVFFLKNYNPSHFILTIQTYFLNIIRSSLLGQFVWTNCPIMKTDIFYNSLNFNIGFLEDVVLSDYLRTNFKSTIIKHKVIVSSRRYIEDGIIKRIKNNIHIMWLYRMKKISPKKLKQQYYG